MEAMKRALREMARMLQRSKELGVALRIAFTTAIIPVVLRIMQLNMQRGLRFCWTSRHVSHWRGTLRQPN